MLGDLIQIKRYEKKLTLGQLAQKMGIATASVRRWEEGICLPNDAQIGFLTKNSGLWKFRSADIDGRDLIAITDAPFYKDHLQPMALCSIFSFALAQVAQSQTRGNL